jgi:intein-encoded DNA endonuclease-like protein
MLSSQDIGQPIVQVYVRYVKGGRGCKVRNKVNISKTQVLKLCKSREIENKKIKMIMMKVM